MSNKIQIFEAQNVRSHWDEEQEKWFFSIVDVVAILSQSVDAQSYWRKLKQRLIQEGNETVTNCHGLKMLAKDGKMRLTDVADTEQLLRIIQSVPSKKAEPFKMWLAKVGSERIDETEDPELAFDRAIRSYLDKGYSKEWEQRGIQEGLEYGILTNELTRAWTGKSVKEYKAFKGLKKENLRDNMSNLELVLNMLAEASTTEISKVQKPQGLQQNKEVAKKGGNAAKSARLEIEKETGEAIVTSNNSKKLLDKKSQL